MCYAALAAVAACADDPAAPRVNPVPSIGALSPTVVTAGSGEFTLTVHGSDFVNASVVRWSGTDLSTTMISTVQLRATVASPLIATAGINAVAVFNPAPGGGLSTSANLEVRNPVPALSGVSPASQAVGSPPMPISITGSGFVSTSVVRWNGGNLATTFTSVSELIAMLDAASLATAGTGQVSVFNGGPGGGVSGSLPFDVTNPVPAIASLSPASQQLGGGAVTLQVTGTGFVTGSVVRWNGTDRATGFVSGTQLVATLPASDFTSGGFVPVTVYNPPPGGGTSQPSTFAVGNPMPTITSMSPDSTTAGGPGFTLTVDGTGFVAGATIWYRYSPRPTTLVSSTRLTAPVSDTSIVSGGYAPVLVVNPAPGGGPSAPDTVRVFNPVPTIGGVTPDTVTAGSGFQTVTIDGTGFVPGSTVRIDNTNRSTTYVSPSRLTAYLWDIDVANGGARSLTVFNEAPGGGTSPGFDLLVVNPIAVATRLSPDNALAGSGQLALTVNGSGFVGPSVVRWNGQDLATSYTSASTLTATLSAANLSGVGYDTVVVYNPPPGGGVSSPLLFVVRAPLPVATALSPATASPGDSGFTLTVSGSGFASGATVRWNGASRPTTFVSASQLTAAIPASDLAATTTALVTVENPAPGGGTSGALGFTVGTPGSTTPTITSQLTLAVPTRDLAYDSVSGRLYASVPSSGGGVANTIIAIDPATGSIVDTVAAGSEPNELAISGDGQFLYVGLGGSPAIRRFRLPGLTFDLEILLSPDPFLGSTYAEDIEVQPGAPRTIAVSLRNAGFSPRHMGVAVIDDSIMRPTRSQGHTGSNRIEFSNTAGIVFGHNNETTEFGFRRLVITAAGITEVANTWGIVQYFGLDFTYAGGRAFFTNGTIVDPETRSQLGVCAVAGPVLPSPASGRLYVLNTGTSELFACSISTYTLAGAVTVPSGGGAQRLVRWAPDGVAYRTGSEVVILRSTLVR
jgi:hypothetical protein